MLTYKPYVLLMQVKMVLETGLIYPTVPRTNKYVEHWPYYYSYIACIKATESELTWCVKFCFHYHCRETIMTKYIHDSQSKKTPWWNLAFGYRRLELTWLLYIHSALTLSVGGSRQYTAICPEFVYWAGLSPGRAPFPNNIHDLFTAPCGQYIF